jgi:hypothetical protein
MSVALYQVMLLLLTTVIRVQQEDKPNDVTEFLRRLWLSSPPVVLDIRLSKSVGRIVPGCRLGLHTDMEADGSEPSMVLSCDTLRFSNADSFPSVQHFAVPPTFDTDEIYNGFLLATDGLTISLDGPLGAVVRSLPLSSTYDGSPLPRPPCSFVRTQPLVSPVSGSFLFNKSFLGDLHSSLTLNQKPAKQFLLSASSPFTIKLTKPQLELIVHSSPIVAHAFRRSHSASHNVIVNRSC